MPYFSLNFLFFIKSLVIKRDLDFETLCSSFHMVIGHTPNFRLVLFFVAIHVALICIPLLLGGWVGWGGVV